MTLAEVIFFAFPALVIALAGCVFGSVDEFQPKDDDDEKETEKDL